MQQTKVAASTAVACYCFHNNVGRHSDPTDTAWSAGCGRDPYCSCTRSFSRLLAVIASDQQVAIACNFFTEFLFGVQHMHDAFENRGGVIQQLI